MNTTEITLILMSSLMHAGWNCLGKHSRPSSASFSAAATLGALCLAPLLLFFIDGLMALTPEICLMLIGSCFFQALYFCSLGQAYRYGDMSVMYPLSRSLPVLMVPLVIGVFLGGKAVPIYEWVPFSLIVAGCLLLPMTSLTSFSIASYINKAAFFALIAAVGTAGYSIVDNKALQLLKVAWEVPEVNYKSAALYLILQAVGTAVFIMSALLPFRSQRDEINVLLRYKSRALFFTGLMMFLTYGVALAAMAFSDNISNIVALRQSSIPIGVLMGIVFLGESASLPKWVGTGLLVTGLVLVSF